MLYNICSFVTPGAQSHVTMTRKMFLSFAPSGLNDNFLLDKRINGKNVKYRREKQTRQTGKPPEVHVSDHQIPRRNKEFRSLLKVKFSLFVSQFCCCLSATNDSLQLLRRLLIRKFESVHFPDFKATSLSKRPKLGITFAF